jgi:hypothetical protein
LFVARETLRDVMTLYGEVNRFLPNEEIAKGVD